MSINVLPPTSAHKLPQPHPGFRVGDHIRAQKCPCISGIAQDVLWTEAPVGELPAEGAVRAIKGAAERHQPAQFNAAMAGARRPRPMI